MTDSDLYLRFVIGEVDPGQLHALPERHIACNPILAQFIDDEQFSAPIVVPEAFAKSGLDPAYVRQRTDLVTRGWQRLQQMARDRSPITEYPLPEVRSQWM
jgi:hypothetical protein